MNTLVSPLAEFSASAIEVIGIGIITLVALYTLIHAGLRLYGGDDRHEVVQEQRQLLGRGILLGLEFLIAADIIYTVAVELTFETIGVLGVVVLIRTFLSFTLELELNGKWPWQS